MATVEEISMTLPADMLVMIGSAVARGDVMRFSRRGKDSISG